MVAILGGDSFCGKVSIFGGRGDIIRTNLFLVLGGVLYEVPFFYVRSVSIENVPILGGKRVRRFL